MNYIDSFETFEAKKPTNYRDILIDRLKLKGKSLTDFEEALVRLEKGDFEYNYYRKLMGEDPGTKAKDLYDYYIETK